MLYIVPTPIGNREDITMRALRLFAETKYFISEDTRTTKKLLWMYEIDYSKKDFFSLTSFTDDGKLKHFANILQENDVVLVSEAGTPGLSDPGKKMVEVCNQNWLLYSVLPGANALIPAVVWAGFDTSKFVFLGFLPQKKWKQTLIKKIIANEWWMPVFFYESVHRIQKTLQEFQNLWFEWKVSLSREISKLHEQIINDDINQTLKKLSTWEIVEKWEFVVGIQSN